KGLGITLFERVYKQYNDDVTRMLEIQYRMNKEIMEWSSKEFYKGKLKAHPSVEDHLLTDLEGVEETDETCTPLFMIDTANSGLEETGDEGDSKSNTGEVELVKKHVEKLLEAGLKESQISVITPYSAQVELLRS